MTTKIIFFYFLLLMVSASITAPLKLNFKEWATVWGSQELFFQPNWEEYFHSIDGTYHFAYDTGKEKEQSFRSEKRLLDGTLIGFYGFIDPEGVLRITEYIAGLQGYRQRTTIRNFILFYNK